jgi:hypothetical protein
MSNSTVSYSFNEFDLTVDLVVNTDLQDFNASDEKPYPGYAVISGSGQYTANGQQFKFQVAPQTVNPYNVLWAASGAGNGGSSNGLDTTGVAIMGDNGYLAWSEGQNFWINTGAINGAVTLQSVNGWPIG